MKFVPRNHFTICNIKQYYILCLLTHWCLYKSPYDIKMYLPDIKCMYSNSIPLAFIPKRPNQFIFGLGLGLWYENIYVCRLVVQIALMNHFVATQLIAAHYTYLHINTSVSKNDSTCRAVFDKNVVHKFGRLHVFHPSFPNQCYPLTSHRFVEYGQHCSR